MLQSAGILNIHEGKDVGNLTYGTVDKKTGRPTAVRKYNENHVTLQAGLDTLVDKLLASYPYYAKPYPEDEISKKFNSSIVVEMYSFYPPELLEEIGMDTEDDRAIATMLQIASDVNYYSREETATGAKFEDALTNAFNMFIDVDAQRIGGAGNADIMFLSSR